MTEPTYTIDGQTVTLSDVIAVVSVPQVGNVLYTGKGSFPFALVPQALIDDWYAAQA